MRKAQRDRLILAHIGWATWIARECWLRAPILEYEECVGEAMIGLLLASASYDPKRGKFSSWAAVKIRGAIADRLRRDELLGRDQRTPLEKELAPRAKPHRVDGDVGDIAEAKTAYVAGFPFLPPTQETQVEARLALYRLRDAARALPGRLGTAYARYYFEDVDLKTIAKDMGVTESRVCQMMSEARRLLAA